MLGIGLALGPYYSVQRSLSLPAGFGWDSGRFPLSLRLSGARRESGLAPRDLVDPGIWTGVAIHVDGAAGNDSNSGLGAEDGDFSAAKRTIWSAFVAGNATGAAYRVIVASGDFSNSAFTRNGNEEPSQPVAILGWGGNVRYRAGPWSASWSAEAGGTYSTTQNSVRRVFRTDVLNPRGLYTELTRVADISTCAATPDSWTLAGSTVHVNIGGVPGSRDIALIRSFHGARFLNHSDDLYMENIHCEGGITGALHCDAVANRNVVGVNCSFRYSAPSNPSAPLDAVRVRRTNGLAAFFDCDASFGAKDGWSFHEDGTAGLTVLMQGCSGSDNGAFGSTSVNALTLHDGVRLIDLDGRYGWSRNGSEVHAIQTTQSWLSGTQVTARDIDAESTALKCSNQSLMWLENVTADAAGAPSNYAIEANGGTVFTKEFQAISGSIETVSGGSVTPF